MSLHPTELLSMGVPWRFQITDSGFPPIAEKNIHTTHWAWRSQAGAYLQPSTLLTSEASSFDSPFFLCSNTCTYNPKLFLLFLFLFYLASVYFRGLSMFFLVYTRKTHASPESLIYNFFQIWTYWERCVSGYLHFWKFLLIFFLIVKVSNIPSISSNRFSLF